MLVKFARAEGRKLRIIVTGTGRSGTGFASRWLTSIGLPSGHEAFFDWRGLDHARRRLAARDFHLVGDCAWEAAPHLESDLLCDALVVHQVRHPKKVIESCLRVPESTTPHFERYLEEQLPLMLQYRSNLDKATCRWVHWNKMIERQLDRRTCYFWRVEDGTDGFLAWLDEQGLVDAGKVVPNRMYSNTHHNHKHGPEQVAHLDKIAPELRGELIDLMARYGYEDWE